MRCVTLRKYVDLMPFADKPEYRQFIKDWTPQTNETAPVDLITVPKLLKWIKETSYYKTEATRSQYANRFDNSKMKSAKNHMPDLTLRDLLDDDFFTNLQKHPYIKKILSVLRVFIHQHRYEAQYPLDVGRLYKKLKGALEQARDEEDLRLSKKAEDPLEITVDEVLEIFNQIADKTPETCDDDGNFMGLGKDEILGLVCACYSCNGFRDDLQYLVMNPKTIEETMNYLDTKTGMIVIQKHKTSNSFGPLRSRDRGASRGPMAPMPMSTGRLGILRTRGTLAVPASTRWSSFTRLGTVFGQPSRRPARFRPN